MQPSTPREVERVIAQPPANDDRKPAMATKPTLVTTTCSPAADTRRSHGRYRRRQAGASAQGAGAWQDIRTSVGGAVREVTSRDSEGGLAWPAWLSPRLAVATVRRVKGFIPRSRPL